MLGELCDERGREDGFIHRILFSFPDAMSRKLTGKGVRPETLDRYCQFVKKLRYQGMIMCSEDPATVVLDMSPDAFRLFQDWANEHYVEMESGPVNLRGPWAKLVTYCARFALILHLASNVGQRTVASVVDAESVSRAISLAMYFKSHARRVYGHLFASPEERQILAAIEWFKRRPGQSGSQRDFLTSKVGGVRTSQDTASVFQLLERNGWGRIEQITSPRGGPPSILFTLDCRSNADRLQTPGGWRN